jgi:succinyl-CoA synthetase alpha subunit
MWHAGAIISGGKGTFDSKIEALAKVGVRVAELPRQIPGLVREAISL